MDGELEKLILLFLSKCGLFQCECQFASLVTGEMQKEAYLVAISFGDSVVCQSGNDSQVWQFVAPPPKVTVIFKYIVVWACQAELKTVGLLFCVHSFLL